MFGARMRICRLLGIPVYVDASWLVIVALLTLTLGNAFPQLVQNYFPGAEQRLDAWKYWGIGLFTTLGFFACILLHELGHAVVARAQGMPIRGITLFMFGGVAELGDEPPSAWSEFWMAIAGPLVTVVLAAALAVLTSAGYQAGWPPVVVIALGYLTFINLILLAFNMIPAFPLDGGRVLRSILWGITGQLRPATYWASILGQGFAWLLIAWGVLMFFGGNWLGGIWMGLIGLFLNAAARGSYQQVLIRELLTGESVRRFMTGSPIVAPSQLDLQTWVEEYVYRHDRRTFPVVDAEGRLAGIINTQVLANIPRGEWTQHTVGEVMRHDVRELTISPDADAMAALSKMQRNQTSSLTVVDGGRLVGVITLRDLMRFLNLKLELEGLENGAGSRRFGRGATQPREHLVEH